jgi:hypothetical protein
LAIARKTGASHEVHQAHNHRGSGRRDQRRHGSDGLGLLHRRKVRHQRLYDAGGAVVTAWTVDNLKPSTDRIPAYPLHGTLWEATATIEPVRGTVTPLIPNLNARADNGRNYQALWEAFMPQGISGASIPQGARSTGKIYFDVTGQTPSRVMYNNGVQDLLIWEK